MTKPRKDTDYLFLSARIRSLEKDLLTSQRLEQLLTAPSVEACAQLLSEWGYAPVHDEPSLQAALSAQREAVFADVSRFMPEAEVLDVFRLKYDYHNIKTLLKAPQDAERLLIDAGTVPSETMQKKHAENGGWDFLPADMAAAADEAQRVLAETGSARSSDCILDRAYFARLEKLAADSHIPYLQDYVRAMIDAANLRSLIRTQRLGLDAGFLREVLFPGGSVTPEAIRAGSGSGAAALWRGTAFARAAELGMTNTTFRNACGLDTEGHLSTARDVAVLSRYLLNTCPELLHYTGIWTDTLRGGATQLVNTNKLLKRYNGITGLKTGTTSGAGVCISASATRDGLTLIAVVLGSLSSSERFTAATTLLDYGFAAYAAVPLPAMEDRPLLIKVKGSAEESVPLDYTALPETLLMPKENAAALTAQLDLPQELEAPVQLGQTVGTVRILSGETQLGEYEVRAAADAEKMDFGTAFGLLWDALTGCES